MFARVKKSGKYQYLQIVENRKEQGKVKQRVIATVGRMDRLQAKGRVDFLNKHSWYCPAKVILPPTQRKSGPFLFLSASGARPASRKPLNAY